MASTPSAQLATHTSRPAGGVPATRLSKAIDLSVEYLVKACDPNGRFAYRVHSESGYTSRSYNILRHAGAIYSLAMFNRVRPGTQAEGSMVRAATFMRMNYMSHDQRSGALVVWSKPTITASDAELGAAGLGLVALTEVAKARPGSIPLEELQALGRFIVSLQRPDGSFFSKYRPGVGPLGGWDSLYYPGEAALGLVDLYEIDPSQQWLDAAGKALSYLATSRQGAQNLPADHWALIATARFLPYCDRAAPTASPDELTRHASRICQAILTEQIKDAAEPRLVGGFAADGRTTPTATRLEGLLAALEFLPRGAMELRAQIEAAAKLGITFLLRTQIVSGPYAGGVPGAVPGLASPIMEGEARASDVRIDYVQHALCAWLRYENLFVSKGGRGRSR